jgi:sugar phosphate isomerase/epimerase
LLNAPPIIVSASAYGTEFVRQRGQSGCIPIIANAGAKGIEIRRELFFADQIEFRDLSSAIAQAGLFTVYSAPTGLFGSRGELNQLELPAIFAEATMLNARFLKLSLGSIPAEFPPRELDTFLSSFSVKLLVENDQTMTGGRIESLEAFFATCQTANIPVRMTFDIGNWYWAGEDPMLAAGSLCSFVDYIHVKAVQRLNGKLITVPLEESDGSWGQILKALPTQIPRGIEFPIRSEDLEKRSREYVTELERA